jgi:hypothetical protein
MDCTCASSTQPPWRRPLLTQRKGYRQDGRLGRLQGSYVGQQLVPSGEAAAALAAAAAVGGSTDTSRGDAEGVGGTSRVGPGWASSAAAGGFRFDAGEVELVINGRRCVQRTDGAWLDATTGEPCEEVQ